MKTLGSACAFFSLLILGSFLGACSQKGSPKHSQNFDRPVRSIIAGSCLDQNKSYEILKSIADEQSDLFILMGDNIYADTLNSQKLASDYAKLSSDPEFQKIKDQSLFLATWDDHDYGLNDSGAENPNKKGSQKAFLDFLAEPTSSAKRKQEGIYDVREFTIDGKLLRVIILDTRFFRTPLLESPKALPYPGKYIPNLDPKAGILGSKQWTWLEKNLTKLADFQIIVSSIQVLATQHGFEKWENFPLERKRLLGIIEKQAAPVLILSGDRHKAAFYEKILPNGKPLYEVTSSSLNRPLPERFHRPDPSFYRSHEEIYAPNFARLDFDWEKSTLDIRIKDTHRQTLASKTILFNSGLER